VTGCSEGKIIVW
jgi:hypothetical protein